MMARAQEGHDVIRHPHASAENLNPDGLSVLLDVLVLVLDVVFVLVLVLVLGLFVTGVASQGARRNPFLQLLDAEATLLLDVGL